MRHPVLGSTAAVHMVLGAATLVAIACGCSKDSEAAPPAGSSVSQAALSAPAANHVDGKNYKIDIALAGECTVQTECKLEVKLQAVGDFHINKEYPYKLKAEGSGVTFTGTDAAGPNVFSKAAGDFKIDEEKKATMTVKFKPSKAGPLTIGGTYKMSVCSKDQCQLETQEISATVTAK